jgi:hypothetical protein
MMYHIFLMMNIMINYLVYVHIDSDDIDSDNMFTDAEIINTQWFATKRNKS